MESFFLNPAYVIPGAALISSPIIIHLINRLRYRRVRFAAMEFLLISQQKNRRRILIEQLILLLLRILIVLAIVALISRLILSRTQWAILQGKAASHHVILVDDSGSMQERIGEESAFERAKIAARRLVERASKEPGEQRVSIYFLSKLLKNEADARLVNQQATEEFVRQVLTAFENVKCTYQQLDLQEGLKRAGRKLLDNKETRTAVKYVHVISDFRSDDWKTQTSMVDSVERLTQADVTVDFLRAVKQGRPNLAVTRVRAAVETAAANVPLPIHVAVRNFSDKPAENVQVRIVADGKTLPRVVLFDRIGANDEVEKDAYVIFETSGPHRLRLELPVDPLPTDNIRYLAVENLPQVNRVLLVNGDPTGLDGLDVKNALSANPKYSGVQLELQGLDYLRQNPLESFQCIILINVPSLAPDAQVPLERYVQAGGGLVWFMGNLVDPTFYNDKLYRRTTENDEKGVPSTRVTGLFPVPLSITSAEFQRGADTADVPPLKIDATHPIFKVLAEAAFADVGSVKRYWPAARQLPRSRDEWSPDDEKRKDGVRTLVSLRTGSGERPLFLEHQFSRGRVITCLTSAGLSWNDWPTLQHYPVLMMRIRDYVVQNAADRQRIVGEPISERLPMDTYTGGIEIETPDLGVGQSIPWEAKTLQAGSDGKTPDEEEAAAKDLYGVDYTQTGLPGIYKLDLKRHKAAVDVGGTNEVRMYAYNVPVQESATEVTPDDEITRHFRNNDDFHLYNADDEAPFVGKQPEQELRKFLLAGLLLLLVGEQLLACRLSYHTRDE